MYPVGSGACVRLVPCGTLGQARVGAAGKVGAAGRAGPGYTKLDGPELCLKPGFLREEAQWGVHWVHSLGTFCVQGAEPGRVSVKSQTS